MRSGGTWQVRWISGSMSPPLSWSVVVILALPFGAMTGRRNVYVGVASSLVICFIYFVLTQVMLALGAGGYLPPLIAAWLPLALVPRGLFLYHMLGGLPAMFLGLALGLTYLRSIRGFMPGMALRLSGAVPATAYLVMVIGFFLYFYPLWTGLPLTADALNSHVWFAFVKPLPNWCLCYWTSPG